MSNITQVSDIMNKLKNVSEKWRNHPVPGVIDMELWATDDQYRINMIALYLVYKYDVKNPAPLPVKFRVDSIKSMQSFGRKHLSPRETDAGLMPPHFDERVTLIMCMQFLFF